MRLIRHSLILIFLLASPVLPASSGGGGEGEGAAPTASPINQDEKEFISKTSKLNTLTNRISEAERRFSELVKKKSLAKTPEEKHVFIKEMVETANQRNKDVEAYNRVRSELNLRYPSQGKQLDRRYHIQDKRSFEELEGVAGLDEMLTRTRKQVERKYAPFDPPDESKLKSTAPVDVQPEKKPKLRLER
jgi:hypothetical protein